MPRLGGYRNLLLGILYLLICGGLGAFAGKEAISEMGNTFVSLGIGVTGVITGRGFNKWAENGKRPPTE